MLRQVILVGGNSHQTMLIDDIDQDQKWLSVFSFAFYFRRHRFSSPVLAAVPVVVVVVCFLDARVRVYLGYTPA